MTGIAIALLACGAPASNRGAPTTSELVAVMGVPPLPPGVFLQVFLRDTGMTWRVAEDGRWLVTRPGEPERQERPLSRLHPGADRLGTAALRRLRGALEAADFPRLPATLPPALAEGTVLSGGDGLHLHPVAFTARLAGVEHTVEIPADPAVPESLGVLAGVGRVLDEEALGGWLGE